MSACDAPVAVSQNRSSCYGMSASFESHAVTGDLTALPMLMFFFLGCRNIIMSGSISPLQAAVDFSWLEAVFGCTGRSAKSLCRWNVGV